ncbi:efflux RND transporter periplasmic adaptor subunit [Balneola sp. MJW-20]|uniref:efflux RND transporter periplasmic adaptor subunit n=1 Tax=Gracilimonas aurantiaca TaxID=3234185 RepID=UPI003467D626
MLKPESKTIKGILLLVLPAVLLMTACKSQEEEADRPDTESVEIRPEVVFTEVDGEPLRFYIESRGVVEPIRRANITTRISGFVEEHQIQEGARVQKGDTLLKFVDEEAKYDLQQAYNQYLKAKNEFDVQVRGREALSIQNSKDQQELTRINTGLAEAEVAYERAQLNYSYTSVIAPFSGILSLRELMNNRSYVSAGSYIGSGQQLGTLIDASVVRVRLDVLESEIDVLRPGMMVDLIDPSGESFEGRIISVSPEVDPGTKTGQVLVEAQNSQGNLKTGMTVEGRVFVRSQQAKVRMPREALLERDGRTLVFKLNRDEVQWIYVTPVAMNTEFVLIDNEEIAPGDTLAVDQHFSISHQQKVVPLMAN